MSLISQVIVFKKAGSKVVHFLILTGLFVLWSPNSRLRQLFVWNNIPKRLKNSILLKTGKRIKRHTAKKNRKNLHK